jgi:hypothetical protein
MSIVLQSSSGGSVTIAEPTTASNFTQTLPAATGNVVLDSTVGVCRAWVNFNGTGTVAIRASFNVSSITDNGTGDYTINFTTAFPDTSYNAVTTCSAGAGLMRTYDEVAPRTTTSLRVICFQSNTGTSTDPIVGSVTACR